ncbi:MAG: ABC transporter ATP-binding protein, partial [Chloroflexi bacterium]|nr:ABC transporter ATP-binding protein [Chloroflexota bacterium]
CLVGPSGCGKTTLLNLVAGLEQPSQGEALLGGQPVRGPGPDRAMVFQEYALFPWLTVEQNVDFGLRHTGVPRLRRRELVAQYLDLVGLHDFSRARPHQLSGGMQQRVALARALALSPKVLLMDEPFAAVDAQTRNRMQAELLEVWSKERTTVVFVTHNVDEAVYLADRILVLTPRPGRLLNPLSVELPRPRRRTSPEFNQVREAVLELLSTMAGRPLD